MIPCSDPTTPMPTDTTTGSDSPWWRDSRAGPLVVAGIALVASGLIHLAVWGILGGSWEGPVSWRKPILFGISAGLTGLSLGWVFAAVPRRRGDDPIAVATAWAIVVEVALIDLQCWRGVASHFNRSTTFDSVLYDAMGVLILLVTATAAWLTLRSFRGGLAQPADMQLATQAGLVFLLASSALGVVVSVYGDLRVAAGLPPESFGAAGVPKFPHGAVIHALQWLPALAWLARRAGLEVATRTRLVGLATLGTGCFGTYALLQTLLGRARFDTTPATAVLLAIGVGALALPMAVIAQAILKANPRAG
jgi:hypothetical protein